MNIFTKYLTKQYRFTLYVPYIQFTSSYYQPLLGLCRISSRISYSRISHYERNGIYRYIGGMKSGFFISSSLFPFNTDPLGKLLNFTRSTFQVSISSYYSAYSSYFHDADSSIVFSPLRPQRLSTNHLIFLMLAELSILHSA